MSIAATRRLLCIVSLAAAPALSQPLPLDHVELPPGFEISVYADGVPNARSLALGAQGSVFVGTRTAGKVYALVDRDGDGRAERVHTVLSGRTMPNGVAFHDGDLYVATRTQVLRLPEVEARLEDPPEPEVVARGFPDERHHGWRFLDIGPDERLYITVGAPCNVCMEYGQIVRMNLDGSGREIFAEGVRNSVGLAWHPQTGDLHFTDNGRDRMGDNLPPDELNRAPRPGLHFGYPHCHGNDIEDPDFGVDYDCGQFSKPLQILGPHVAALGLAFYDQESFPAQYHGDIFIAEHGSWNRSAKIGYRISRVELDETGAAVGYEPFATGWLQGEKAWGRPVDVLVMPDGSVLVSDDQSGVVYRITYRGDAS